jgi:putative nucleotidyltransferase with HDIG domain
MRTAEPAHLIDVHALRVGMFIHLDVGWMSHPFPLSSFKIASSQQLATIRSLGLKQVRWNPQQSDPVDVVVAPVAVAPAVDRSTSSGTPRPAGAFVAPALAAVPETTVAAVCLGPAPATPPAGSDATGAGSASAAAPDGGAAAPLAGAPAGRAGHDRQLDLDAQRAALHLCERQFGEAARACKQTTDMILLKPQEARGQAEALTKALLDKMLDPQEVCIRLLTEAAGDKASMHALNVMLVSLLMGRSFGFTDADLLDLGIGAMLHDIGKIEMPFRLRHPDETFSPGEHRDYEEHVAHGLALARRMGLSAGATLIIAQHHEHADGSGFPLKLVSDRMTAAARIVAIVNRYDNLCNPLFLAKALTPHESLSLLFAQGKSKYDTSILGAFIRMMGVYPPGSTVQLTDDRYAMVVAVNSTRPLKPSVVVHEAGVPRDQALVLDLEAADGLGIRRSIKPAQLPPASFEYLAPRQRVAYFFEPVERRG